MSKKVLLIEDSKVIVDMYKLGFKKAGFAVEVARNGIWGLKLAGRHLFDIIIMDMVMPAMDGYNTIKALKKNERTKDTPIIILSNSAQDNDIREALKLGAASYLLKSQTTPSKLVKEVEKALGKKK